MGKDLLYQDWLKTWLAGKKALVNAASYATYSMAVFNHLIPVLGRYRIGQITEGLVQEKVLWWLKEGRIKAVGGLSEKSVKDLLMIVRLSFCDACHSLKRNPGIWKIRFPQKEWPKRLPVMLLADQRRLTEGILADLTASSAGILLALHSGIRIGELCALQWKDLDLETNTMVISKTLQRVCVKQADGTSSSEVLVGGPKTPASARSIPLNSFICATLSQLTGKAPEAYLITGTSAQREPRSYRSYFTRYLKRNNIPHINFHGLRHTFATRLVEAGADVKTVSELLGHASVNTTLDLYVHPQLEQKRRCVEMMPSFVVP
ncbi:MAG: site-specific integrase [Coriobacteriaceae bacterium]|jgi:integrase|nr:site-specific integrase [Coriobacteriaceae bacterium]